MTDALDTDPERGDVKCVAFLNSDEEGKGGVQLHGWDYDSDALPAIFMHPRAIVRSQQGELLFAPLGDDG
jgi:hypothetical protein